MKRNMIEWGLGTIKRKQGTRMYVIQQDSGRELKCHIDQLREVSIPPKKRVSFATPFAVPTGPIHARDTDTATCERTSRTDTYDYE